MGVSATRLSKAVLVAGVLCVAVAAQGALLVYEPFNYTSGQDLSTLAVTGTGLGTTWAGAAGTFTTQSGSLAFSNFPTSGGKMWIDSAGDPANLWTTIPSNPNATGSDLWCSYLVDMVQFGNNGTSDGIYVNTAKSSESPTVARFIVSPDNMTATNTGNPTTMAPTIGAADGATTNGTGPLAVNTTYLVVADFQVSTSTKGTMWILSPDQYDAIKAGGITLAELNSPGAVTQKIVGTIGSNVGWGAFSKLNFSAWARSASQHEQASIDELRYGTTIDDVLPTPTPEPATLVLMSLSLVGLLRRRRMA